MTNQINVLTIRVNGIIVKAEGIQDNYTIVQPFIRKEWDLNEEAISVIKNDRYAQEYEDSYYLGENDAKDVTGTFGNLKLSIESVEIELN